jgi:hypothetical protein
VSYPSICEAEIWNIFIMGNNLHNSSTFNIYFRGLSQCLILLLDRSSMLSPSLKKGILGIEKIVIILIKLEWILCLFTYFLPCSGEATRSVTWAGAAGARRRH